MQCDQKWIDKDDQLLVLMMHLKWSRVNSQVSKEDFAAALRRQVAAVDAEE